MSRTRDSLRLTSILMNKFQFLPMRDKAPVEGLAEEAPDGFPAPLAVIKCPMVDVHPHESIRQIAAHIARILKRVLHRLSPMIEAELNARRQDIRDFFANLRRKAFMNDVAAER